MNDPDNTTARRPPVVMHIIEPNRRDRRALAREVGVTSAELKEAQAELVERGFIKVHSNPARRPLRVWFTGADDERA